MGRNKNLKVVGFFGQSGAGKTTIIRNVRSPINGNVITQNTGIIRYLFQKNDYYLNPVELLKKNLPLLADMKKNEKNAKIDEIYEKYIRSQLQLLNDFSTEVYIATQEEYYQPTVMLIDRSPIDFYALTVCGIEYLRKELGRPLNDHCKKFIELTRKTAEVNSKNFFDAIIVTQPWKETNINKELADGVRDQYLTDFYIGDNWYGRIKDIQLTNSKVFSIESSITDLSRRAEIVEAHLMGV